MQQGIPVRDASYEGVLSAFDTQCHPHVALVREDPWHCIEHIKQVPSGVRVQCIYNVRGQGAWNLPSKLHLPLLSVCFNCVPPLQHALRDINAPPITIWYRQGTLQGSGHGMHACMAMPGKCQLRAL